MKKSLLLAVASLFLYTPEYARADGIPHPEFQIMGTVYNHGDGYRRALDIGKLEVVFESEYGQLAAAASIRKGDSPLNYVLEVPAQIGLLDFPAAEEVVDLGAHAEQLWSVADGVRVIYHGETYMATWQRGTATDFQIKRSAWGGSARFDLIVEAPMLDHDGGPVPNDWERLHDDDWPGYIDGPGGGSGSDPSVNPFAGESNWLREDEAVWVKAGVSTVVRFPLKAGSEPVVPEALAYTLVETPATGVLKWVDPSTGAVVTMNPGQSFTEAQMAHGHVRYAGVSGGPDTTTLRVQMVYADTHTSAQEDVVLQIWEPSAGGSFGATLWMDARRQGGEVYTGVRNFANTTGEEWAVVGDVSLPAAGDGVFGFVNGAAVAPVGAGSAEALSGDSVEVFAAFAGGPGPVLSSADLGMNQLGGAVSGYEQVRFGRRSEAVAREWPGPGAAVFHGWLRDGAYALSADGDPGGLGFRDPETARMGERAAVGARLGEGGALEETWAGSLHELLVYPRRMNEIERTRLRAYLQAKTMALNPVIVDAAHALRPVVQAVPDGETTPHVFLGWQARTWFRGGAGDDAFHVGGGEHVLEGGGGNNRFVFLLDGGHDHRLIGFSRSHDVLDLSALFREPMTGPVVDYLRASRDGEDSILAVYRAGAVQNAPSLTLRFEGWSGLTQERVPELLRKGVIQAGELVVRPVVTWDLRRAEVEETGQQPAHIRLVWEGEDLPMGQAVPLRIESTDTKANVDFRVVATQFDPATGELVTAPVSEAGLRVPPEAHPRIDLYVEAIPNTVTQDPREIILSLYDHPVRYRAVGSPDQRTVQLLDGPAVLTIHALDSKAGPDSPTEFVLERAGALDQALNVSLDVGGTAESSKDFAYIGSSTVFAAGESTLSIPLQPLRKVSSPDSNRVILRIEDGSGYRFAGDGMASVWLAVALRELQIVKLSGVADSYPDGTRTAQFFVRKTEALQGRDLLVNLGFTGNVSLSHVSVEMPHVVADLNFSGPADEKVLLLPASTSSFILTIRADADLAAGSAGRYIEGRFTPLAGEDFTMASPDTFTVHFREAIEAWAQRHGAGMVDLDTWLVTQNVASGLTPLEAYAFGISPDAPRDASTTPGIEKDDEGMLRISIPFFAGAAGAVDTALQRSGDMRLWAGADAFEWIGDERVGERFFRVFRGPADNNGDFFRLFLEKR